MIIHYVTGYEYKTMLGGLHLEYKFKRGMLQHHNMGRVHYNVGLGRCKSRG